MKATLRDAEESDRDFALQVKHAALSPYVEPYWGWEEVAQQQIHLRRWNEKPWQVILIDGQPVGTVSVAWEASHVQIGEFYLMPAIQRLGIGSEVLRDILAQSDKRGLEARLEYIKWNPVASLYGRLGFKVVRESETHCYCVRAPHVV